MYIVAALGQWPLVAGCFAGHAVGALLFGAFAMTSPRLIYEVRPRKDLRGVDLISDALPFGRLWYGASQTQLAMQLATRSFAAAHMMPFAFMTKRAE